MKCCLNNSVSTNQVVRFSPLSRLSPLKRKNILFFNRLTGLTGNWLNLFLDILPAVYLDNFSGNMFGFVGCQKCHQISEIFRLSNAFDGTFTHGQIDDFISGFRFFKHGGFDQTGGHCILRLRQRRRAPLQAPWYIR